MQHRITTAAFAAVALAAAPASAAHVELGAGVDTRSNSSGFTFAAPLGQASNRNLNGRALEDSVSGPNSYSHLSPVIPGATGAFRPDVTAVSVASGIAGEVLTSGPVSWGNWTVDTTSYANLATGKLGASVHTTGSGYTGQPFEPFASVRGTTSSSLTETIFFTNSSGGDLVIDVQLRVKGAIIPTAPLPISNGNGSGQGDPIYDLNWANGVTLLTLSGCGGCGNAEGAHIRGYTRESGGIGDQIRTPFNIDGRGVSTNFNMPEGNPGFPDYFSVSDNPGAAFIGPFETLIDYSVSTKLIIPNGFTTLGLGVQFDLSCQGFFLCAFSETAGLSFGALPEGLSWTSQSGAFLRDWEAPGGPGGAIPEPASWAMLIAGFGLVGGAVRRRMQAA